MSAEPLWSTGDMARELGGWTGAGLDDVEISVDGVEVFD